MASLIDENGLKFEPKEGFLSGHIFERHTYISA